MSTKLRDLIRNVRACKTASEERAIIAKECAEIRTAFKGKADDLRHRHVAKLLYIHMLGYPTHFGQIEAIKLIASSKFGEKRIGYLALMLLLDEDETLLMMGTNSMKNDLLSNNPFVSALALCAVGNICSSDIASDLLRDVGKVMMKDNPYLRKKAALCSIRIIRKLPDAVEEYIELAPELLKDRNHAVLLTGIKLMIEITKVKPDVIPSYRQHISRLINILKGLYLSGFMHEYDVMGIADPFLQAAVLHLLRILGENCASASEQMNEILASIVINTDSTKIPGTAIVYECVRTIMNIEAEGGLKVLAINTLVVNKYSPTRAWYIHTLADVLKIGGNAATDAVLVDLVSMIGRNRDLHPYAAYQLFYACNQQHSLQQHLLVQSTMWCIGEFGEHLVSTESAVRATEASSEAHQEQYQALQPTDVLTLIQAVVKSPHTTVTTHQYALNCLVKLSSRFHAYSECTSTILTLLQHYKRNIHVELQQRSVEYTMLTKTDHDLKNKVLARMPCAQPGSDAIVIEDSKEDVVTPPVQTSPVVHTNVIGLDDLLGNHAGLLPQAPVPVVNANPSVLDIFDVFSAPVLSTSPAPQGKVYPSKNVYNAHGVSVDLITTETAPGAVKVTAKITNQNPMPISSFDFQVAVPAYIEKVLYPVSNSTIVPMGNATQKFEFQNTQVGTKQLVMKARIVFSLNGENKMEQTAPISLP